MTLLFGLLSPKTPIEIFEQKGFHEQVIICLMTFYIFFVCLKARSHSNSATMVSPQRFCDRQLLQKFSTSNKLVVNTSSMCILLTTFNQLILFYHLSHFVLLKPGREVSKISMSQRLIRDQSHTEAFKMEKMNRMKFISTFLINGQI